MTGDDTIDTVEGGCRLLKEDVDQRCFSGSDPIEIDPVVVAAAAAADRPRPVEAARPFGRVRNTVGRAVMMEGFGGEIDVERRIGGTVARRDQLVGGRGFAAGRCGVGGCDVVTAGIKQWIFFELSPNKRFEFDVGQRQQLDRLLQLDRHHQRLALAEIEAGTDAHGRRSGPPP